MAGNLTRLRGDFGEQRDADGVGDLIDDPGHHPHDVPVGVITRAEQLGDQDGQDEPGGPVGEREAPVGQAGAQQSPCQGGTCAQPGQIARASTGVRGPTPTPRSRPRRAARGKQRGGGGVAHETGYGERRDGDQGRGQAALSDVPAASQRDRDMVERITTVPRTTCSMKDRDQHGAEDRPEGGQYGQHAERAGSDDQGRVTTMVSAPSSSTGGGRSRSGRP